MIWPAFVLFLVACQVALAASSPAYVPGSLSIIPRNALQTLGPELDIALPTSCKEYIDSSECVDSIASHSVVSVTTIDRQNELIVSPTMTSTSTTNEGTTRDSSATITITTLPGDTILVSKIEPRSPQLMPPVYSSQSSTVYLSSAPGMGYPFQPLEDGSNNVLVQSGALNGNATSKSEGSRMAIGKMASSFRVWGVSVVSLILGICLVWV